MNTDRQRDADLDRVLRATLRQWSASPADACPDAGILAALLEGGVQTDERAALDSHLSACGRCQQTLATMALDVPGPPAADRVAAARTNPTWLWRGHLHWLIPVTAASALVIYVASRSAIAPSGPTAPAVPESTQASAAPSQAIPPAAAPPRPAGSGGGAPRKQEIVQAPALAGELRSPAPAATGTRAAADAQEPSRMAEAMPSPEAPRPKGEQVRAAAEPAAGVAARADQDAQAVKPAAEPVAPAPQNTFAPLASASREERAVLGAPPAGAAAASAAKISATDAAREAPLPPAARDRAAGTAPPSIVEAWAGDSGIGWRVGLRGAIWRSADEGRTWYPQKSGVTADLLAAFAPSVTACWAVGTSGTVLLADDGEHWERRPFPEAVDLVAVDARSTHQATVITRDGRRFTTANRGATWIGPRE